MVTSYRCPAQHLPPLHPSAEICSCSASARSREFTPSPPASQPRSTCARWPRDAGPQRPYRARSVLCLRALSTILKVHIPPAGHTCLRARREQPVGGGVERNVGASGGVIQPHSALHRRRGARVPYAVGAIANNGGTCAQEETRTRGIPGRADTSGRESPTSGWWSRKISRRASGAWF